MHAIHVSAIYEGYAKLDHCCDMILWYVDACKRSCCLLQLVEVIAKFTSVVFGINSMSNAQSNIKQS